MRTFSRKGLGFLLFLSFFSLCSVNAQLSEGAQKPGFTGTTSCILHDSAGTWLSAGNFKDGTEYGNPAFVMKMDSLGHTLWSVTPVQPAFANPDVCDIRDMIRTSDGNIVITGVFHACGTAMGEGFIQKLSQSGATIWSKAYLPPYVQYNIPFTHIKELKSGRLCLTADTMVYFAKSTGDSIWAHHYNVGKLYGVEENHLHQLIVVCKKGILKLDTLGNKISLTAFSVPVLSISQQADSSYVIINGGAAVRLDTSFAPMASLNLNTYFASVSRLRVRNGACYMAGKDTVSGAVRLMTCTPQMVLIHTHTWGNTKVKAADLDWRPMQVLAGGMETTVTNSNPYFKAFNDTLYGGIDSTDAGVIRVTVDSSYSIHQVIAPPSDYDIHFRPHVTIKNFGNDSIHSIYLNAYFHGTSCSPDNFLGKYMVHLGPGDTVVLNPGWVVTTNVHYTSAFASYTLQSCFWTSVPNGITDKNPANDEQCSAAFVTSYPAGTGILEYSLQDAVSVFPNPARSAFSLQLPEAGYENYRISLYTSNGQLIQTRENKSSSLLQWDISNFASGLYFLEIRGLVSGKRAFKKIAVE
ncbi:MAG: T9SS type A sorting domain-containing protein [Bacteroidia bacterium]